jgi:hypothetical protein
MPIKRDFILVLVTSLYIFSTGRLSVSAIISSLTSYKLDCQWERILNDSRSQGKRTKVEGGNLFGRMNRILEHTKSHPLLHLESYTYQD